MGSEYVLIYNDVRVKSLRIIMSYQFKIKKFVNTIIKSNYFKLFIYSNVSVSIFGIVIFRAFGDGGYNYEQLSEFRSSIVDFACIFVLSWGIIGAIINWYKDSNKKRIIRVMQIVQGILTPFVVPLWFFFTPSASVILLYYYRFY